MGWLYRNQKLRHETPLDYFKRGLTFANEHGSATVLDAATVRGTVYAAVRNQHRRTGTDYVFCAIILFKNSERYGFGYKEICESMGPYEVDCPDRIMNLLSPVSQIPDSSLAADWRESVAAAKRNRKRTTSLVAKLRPGVIVRLEHAVTFAKSGITANRFRLRSFHGRTPIFEPVDVPTFRCRLQRDILLGASIEPQPMSGRTD